MAPARVAPAPAGTKPLFWQTPLFATLLLAVAALLAYQNSFAVPFVFDDEMAIVSNPSIHHLASAWQPPEELSGLPMSGRPVVNFSFGLSYAIGGSEVWSYHAFNLLVHVAAGLLLFGLVRRTLLQPGLAPRFRAQAFELALLVAAIWTLHPLQTESVTYISQRAEALLGLLYLFTLWCFVRGTECDPPGDRLARRRQVFWHAAATVACAAGMITKEAMVSAPLFAALYARAFRAGSWRDVWARYRRPLLALAGTWLVLAWVVVREGGARGASAGFGLGVSWWSYLLTQCEAIVRYLELSLWPHPLVLDYGTALVHSAADVWWQGLLLLGLFGGTLWAFARTPAAGCLGAWFFLILAPSSSVIPLVGQTAAEHRMYLPLAGVVVGAVLAAYRLLGRKALALLALAAVAMAAVTADRNRDYATKVSTCESTVSQCPGNGRAMALLADYYRRAGLLYPARQWLERSLRVQPRVVPVLNNLGNVWQELGDLTRATACFQQALAIDPRNATTLNNLGNALVLGGNVAEGISQLEAAVRLAPDARGTRANLANALAQSGRLPEAAGQFEALVKAQPNDAEAHASYGRVLQALGRTSAGIEELDTAVRLRPDNAELHDSLGVALGRAGRVREALEQFQAALRLNPADESARQNAALAQRRLRGN